MGKEYNYHAPPPRHPPLFLDQREVRKVRGSPSLISGSGWPPPSPPFLKVWIRHCNVPDYIQTWLNTSFETGLTEWKIKTKNTRLFWNKWNKCNVSDIITLFFRLVTRLKHGLSYRAWNDIKNEFKGKSRGNRFWLEVGTRFDLTRVWIEGVEGLHCIPDSHIQQNSTSDLNLVSDTQSNYLSPFLSV